MRRKPKNQFSTVIPAYSVNEAFARMAVSAFISMIDPRVNELADMKTAVSEAVTNAIVHAYRGEDRRNEKYVYISGELYDDRLVVITVRDKGKGIEDVKKAMEPLFTTASDEERSGMGFTVMESFTDKVKVRSSPGKGTSVRLYKKFSV